MNNQHHSDNDDEQFTPDAIDQQIDALLLPNAPLQQQHADARVLHDLAALYMQDAASLERIWERLSEHSAFADANSQGEEAQRFHIDGRTSEKTLDHENTLQGQRDGSGSLQRNVEQRKRSTIVRVLSSLAAVIIVGALVGSWVLVTHLAMHHQTTQTEPTAPTTKAVEPLTTIQMVDQQNGWALTNTSILQTHDGGLHWNDVSPANVPHLVGLQGTFLNASTAWVTVAGLVTLETSENIPLRVLHTTDGGKHWDSIALPQSDGQVIGPPDFINAQDGWLEIGIEAATGNEGVEIYRTTDGGKTWEEVSRTTLQTGRAAGHLPWFGLKSGISFLNAHTGWATGGEAPTIWLYVTHDGGGTWQPQPLTWPSGVVSSLATTAPPVFFGKDGLLPVLLNGLHRNLDLYVTHDGGITWQSTSLTGPYALSIDALDVNRVWVPDATRLAVTSDGGYHWNQIAPNVDFTNVLALDFISSQVGWAIGGRERPQPLLLKTADGGRTWTEITYSIS
jgi:photosystem II stability/assembly factor-like uncharacterized protein